MLLLKSNNSLILGCKNSVISDKVTSIANSAFLNCTSLTSVTIPDSVTSIGSSAFNNCTSLTKVNYLGIIDQWVVIDFGNYLSNPLYFSHDLYINNELVTKVNITTATEISNNAFENCTSLTSVTIGDSVTSISNSAFQGCTSLSSIIIPDSVNSIGDFAFSKCHGLTCITIPDPDSGLSIGYYAFSNCSKLKKIIYKGSTYRLSHFVNFGVKWDQYTGSYTIYCTDGIISK